MPDQAQIVLFLIQLSANVPGRAAEHGPSSWGPSSHMGDPDGLLGSWLQSDPAPAIAAI